MWREIMEGITWFVRERRLAWQISCVTTDEFSATLKSGVDGAICLLRRANQPAVRRLLASRVPAVNLLQIIHPRVPSVMSDNLAIGETAADYLYGRGYRRFAYVGVDRVWSHERGMGFHKWLASRQCEVELCPVGLKPATVSPAINAGVHRALSKWLGSLKRPIAFFACADFVGRILIELSVRAGISVPEECAILGVDNDLAISELTSVPLSSIPQDLRRIGFEAARILESQMCHRRSKSVVRIAPREIVIRRSTDAIAIQNPRIAAALRYITTTDIEHLDIKGLLRHLGVSRQWLDRQFCQAIGSTPSQQIRRQKLAHARALLLETHLSVQSIAVRSGFTQGENLSRFLKNQIGLSPRIFRQKYGFLG